eukprot:CAMPEP_0185276996 /NCGR_PEP_ID=MMETSP1359-20130426/57547_1 /TAXON_ID=552665 /ORGANISM="Bigelowiella longifila, Strain CCMP242" /LENGTH=347 /DNA_ID=CAMNT_0027870911 /DNA_START=1 /DNA_END=1044 /DNA_ORIENTATION=+
MEAQKRMRNARLCVVQFSGLATEIIKNLVLAGVGELTILDDAVATKLDLESNFFLTKDDIGKSRAESAIKRIEALNPNVNVKADVANSKDKDASYFRSFDVVICCEAALPEQFRINSACRDVAGGGKDPVFFASMCMGYDAFFFEDVGPTFQYMPKSAGGDSNGGERKNGESSTANKLKTVHGISMKEAFSTINTIARCKEILGRRMRRHLRLLSTVTILVRNALAEQEGGEYTSDLSSLKRTREKLSPKEAADAVVSDADLESSALTFGGALTSVLSIVGGIMAQEALKVVSRKGEPLHNCVLYDGKRAGGREVFLPPPPVLTSGKAERIASRKRKAPPVEVLDIL